MFYCDTLFLLKSWVVCWLIDFQSRRSVQLVSECMCWPALCGFNVSLFFRAVAALSGQPMKAVPRSQSSLHWVSQRFHWAALGQSHMCITRSLCGPGTLIYFFGPFSESMICCLESMRAQPRRAPRSSLTTLGGHCPELFHSMTSWYFSPFPFQPSV